MSASPSTSCTITGHSSGRFREGRPLRWSAPCAGVYESWAYFLSGFAFNSPSAENVTIANNRTVSEGEAFGPVDSQHSGVTTLTNVEPDGNTSDDIDPTFPSTAQDGQTVTHTEPGYTLARLCPVESGSQLLVDSGRQPAGPQRCLLARPHQQRRDRALRVPDVAGRLDGACVRRDVHHHQRSVDRRRRSGRAV